MAHQNLILFFFTYSIPTPCAELFPGCLTKREEACALGPAICRSTAVYEGGNYVALFSWLLDGLKEEKGEGEGDVSFPRAVVRWELNCRAPSRGSY